MQVDMSPEAVTNRMETLDQLWELAVALQSSEIIDEIPRDGDGQKVAAESDDRNGEK